MRFVRENKSSQRDYLPHWKALDKILLIILIFFTAGAIASFIFLQFSASPIPRSLISAASTTTVAAPTTAASASIAKKISTTTRRLAVANDDKTAATPTTAPSIAPVQEQVPNPPPVANAAAIAIYVNDKLYQTKIEFGASLYDAMRSTPELSFEGKNYPGMGYFVEEINGLKNNPAANKYWIYYVNGQPATVGVSNYILKTNDIITWKYENTNF